MLLSLNVFAQSIQIVYNKPWSYYEDAYLKKIGGEWHFTIDEATKIGEQLGIEWDKSLFDTKQYRMGLEVELEHGLINPQTNVTDDDPLKTGKIALAHLSEISDYYFRLIKLEIDTKPNDSRND